MDEPKVKTKEETEADALAKKEAAAAAAEAKKKADAVAAKAKDVADKKEAEAKKHADQLPFAIGDNVVYRWVCGGPEMTVTDVSEDGKKIECGWFDHASDLRSKIFPVEDLVYCDASKKK